MIPVTPAQEPARFDIIVRRPGRSFLRQHGILQGAPAPAAFVWNDCWRNAIPMLHAEYNDICAYLGCYLNPKVINNHREGSVEHFVRKADDAWKAYEWDNFLLADGRVNSGRDHTFDPIACPFNLTWRPFELILQTGMIAVADGLTLEQEDEAFNLLDALHLDNAVYDRERANYYARYSNRTREDALTNDQIARYAPFIWYEIQRQGLVINEN